MGPLIVLSCICSWATICIAWASSSFAFQLLWIDSLAQYLVSVPHFPAVCQIYLFCFSPDSWFPAADSVHHRAQCLRRIFISCLPTSVFSFSGFFSFLFFILLHSYTILQNLKKKLFLTHIPLLEIPLLQSTSIRK